MAILRRKAAELQSMQLRQVSKRYKNRKLQGTLKLHTGNSKNVNKKAELSQRRP